MHHYFEAITNTSGDSLVGYFARVIDPATQNTVTMSADDNGTPIVTKSGVDNMGSTDDYGNLDFYVAPGTYHLDIYAPNATSFIFRVPSVAMNSSKGDTGATGQTGDVGASDATFSTLAALQAINPAVYPSPRLAAPSGSDGGYINGSFTYQTGNFTGRTDVIALNGIPLTTGALVRPNASTSLYSDSRANIVLPVDRSIPRTMAYMGVDPFTTATQTSRITNAFANAAGDGLKLEGHADAAYRKEGPLPVSCDYDGRGSSFVGIGAVNALQFTGSGKTWKNITTLGSASARTSDDFNGGGIWVNASDFVMENVRVGQVASGQGHAAAGAFFEGASRGTIRSLWSEYSFADSIHVSGGSTDLDFQSPRARYGGDDGFAVVSEVSKNKLCRRISTSDLLVRDNTARGISIVGGEDVYHKRPRIFRTGAAAVLVQSEDSFNTYGVHKWGVEDLYAEGCVTGIGRDPGFSQAAILIQGRAGTATLPDGTVVPLSVQDGFLSGRLNGIGPAASYALTTDSASTIRQGFGLKLENISGAMTVAACVQLGGLDGYGWIAIDGCDGYPFLLMPSLTGDHSYSRLSADNALRKTQTINEALHGDSANNWSNFYADLMKFSNTGSGIVSNVDLSKTFWRRFIVAGNVITHP